MIVVVTFVFICKNTWCGLHVVLVRFIIDWETVKGGMWNGMEYGTEHGMEYGMEYGMEKR